jgi:hypothetical protein
MFNDRKKEAKKNFHSLLVEVNGITRIASYGSHKNTNQVVKQS